MNIALEQIIRSFCWMIFHSIWLGFILSVCAGLVLASTRNARPLIRYNLLVGLFILFLGGVFITFIMEWNKVAPGGSVLSFFAGGMEDNAAAYSILGGLIAALVEFFESNARLIVSAWFLIIVLKAIRLTLEFNYVNRLRHTGISPVPDEWGNRFLELTWRTGIKRKVSFVQSAIVNIPVVIGHLKPVILLPIGVISKLPMAEVEAVLLHELAHIRRNDFLVNFMQKLAEIFFFFNPGLMWVSSLIRIERENCCDDLAISASGAKATYVDALISFKEHAIVEPAMTMALFGKRNVLLQRVMRIVNGNNHIMNRFERMFFFLNLGLLVVIALSVNKGSAIMDPAPVKVSLAETVSQQLAEAGQVMARQENKPDEQDQVVIKSKSAVRKKGKIKNVQQQNMLLNEKKVRVYNSSVTEQDKVNFQTDESAAVRRFEENQAKIAINQSVRVHNQAQRESQQSARSRERMEMSRERMAAQQARNEERKRVQVERMQAQRERAIAQQKRQNAERKSGGLFSGGSRLFLNKRKPENSINKN